MGSDIEILAQKNRACMVAEFAEPTYPDLMTWNSTF